MYISSRKMTTSLVKFVLVVLVQLNFCLPAYGKNLYYTMQLDALEAISSEWLTKNPRPEEYLPGWDRDSKTNKPCFREDLKQSWLGVECLRLPENVSVAGNSEYYVIRVVGLTLREASIFGTLPAAIGDLAPLIFLTLTGNHDLTGIVPEELAKLNDSLVTLDLSNNSLSGGLPNLSEFLSLQTLDLNNNSLSGGLPNLSEFLSLQTLDLSSNKLDGNISTDAFDNLSNLVTMDLSDNNFAGPFPRFSGPHSSGISDTSLGLQMIKHINLSRNAFSAESLSDLSSQIFYQGEVVHPNSSLLLRVLDLSHNNISGDAYDLGLMMRRIGSQIQEVYLDYNNISGTLSLNGNDFLGSKLSFNNSRLPFLSLTNNNIKNVSFNFTLIDQIRLPYISSKIRLDGNPFCDNIAQRGSPDRFAARCFCDQACEPENSEADHAKQVKTDAVKIAAAIVVPSVLLVVLVAALLYRRSTREHKYLLLQMLQKCEEYDVKRTIFTYKELETATRNFHTSMKLGEGSYGAVYKGELSKSNNVAVGELSKSNIIAVKQLHINSQQGMDEFLNEVALISGMKHRNLVKLKGCCLKEKQRLLVYEYVDNHDLEWNLLEGKSKEILSWPTRLGICLGVAHGLHYLHALAQPKIIHRDIKAANILLDNNLEPKIADFGLALLFPEETSHIMTVHVAGTKGYLAPEYATLGQLSEKADVYSFGVVCLEIVSGRRNIDNQMAPEQVVLTNWALKLHREGRAIEILDSRLDNLSENELLEVNRVILTALLCLQYSEALRPLMAHVVAMLQGDLHTDIVDIETADIPLGFDDSRTFEIQQPGLGTIMEDHSVRLFEGQFSTEGSLYLRQRSGRHGIV